MAKSWVSSCLIHDTWKKKIFNWNLKKKVHFLFSLLSRGKNFSFIVTKACKKGLNWAKILYFLHYSTRIFFFGDQCPNTFYIFFAMTKFPRSWLLAGLIFQNNFYTTKSSILTPFAWTDTMTIDKKFLWLFHHRPSLGPRKWRLRETIKNNQRDTKFFFHLQKIFCKKEVWEKVKKPHVWI